MNTIKIKTKAAELLKMCIYLINEARNRKFFPHLRLQASFINVPSQKHKEASFCSSVVLVLPSKLETVEDGEAFERECMCMSKVQ